jgi:ATP-binding protein involved in chromosome partitioning
VPFEPTVRIGGDIGNPVVLSQPESESARAFVALAKQVAARVSVLNFTNSAPPEINVVG